MALYQSLDFFIKRNASNLIFLAQIDFWDFEMDSLLFCFSSFKERSKIWENTETVESILYEKNLIPKRKILNDFVNDKSFQKKIIWKNKGKLGSFKVSKGQDVESPDRALKRCVEQWNKLIDRCQELLITDKSEKTMNQCGMKVDCNLSKYKKTINNKA